MEMKPQHVLAKNIRLSGFSRFHCAFGGSVADRIQWHILVVTNIFVGDLVFWVWWGG